MSKIKIRKLFADNDVRDVIAPSGDPSESLFDPTFIEDTKIDVMLRKFTRGEIHPREPIYADVSEFGDFRQLQERTIYLQNEFDKLPSAIRNLAKNDPANLQNVILDPKNKEFLTEHGFFEKAVNKPDDAVSASGAGTGEQPQKEAQASKTDATASKSEP